MGAMEGGKALRDPMEMPNVGSSVSFLHPEGSRVSMLQPIPVNWHTSERKADIETLKIN
jgi:hypothetical protein